MSFISIVHLLPPYIHDIEDYLSLTATSRGERSIKPSPHTLLLLCYNSRRVFFRPDPVFLLTHLARPLSIWANRSPDNLKRLVESFWSGPEAVLDLAVGVKEVAIIAKWSLGKVREMWEWRMRVVVPVTDLIDKCVGAQWYNTPNFWDGGAEDAATLYAEPDQTFFRMVIYGEMFPTGSVYTRMEYVKYMMPDWHTPPRSSDGSAGLNPSTDILSTRDIRLGEFSYYTSSVKLERDGFVRTIHPLKAVQREIGPYKGEIRDEFATVVLHLLRASPLWRKYECSVDLEGMERVAAKLRGEVLEESEVGQSGETEGERIHIGSAWTTESPNLYQDLCVALCDK